MGAGRRIWPIVAGVAVIAVAVGGVLIARRDSDGAGGAGGPGGSSAGPPRDQLAWAQGLVDAWDQQTSQDFIGVGADWEFRTTGRWADIQGADRPYALALDLHRVATRTTLPDDAPDGTVRWADGRTGHAVPMGARTALERMRATGIKCTNCPPGEFDGVRLRPMTITAATPTTMRVRSSRGWATIPAWRYTFAERPGIQAIQAAVRSAVPPKVARTWQAPLSLRIDRARLGADGRTLTGWFVGGPAGSGQCGENYTGYAVQSGHAVGILVVRVPNDPGWKGDVVCTTEGYDRSVTVKLDAPLGDRVVIETMLGRAVMVER